MARRTVYSFKSTGAMSHFMQRVMEERNLDRTSVIKLALYAFSCYLTRAEVQQLTLEELVEYLESQAAPGHPDYSEFSDDS